MSHGRSAAEGSGEAAVAVRRAGGPEGEVASALVLLHFVCTTSPKHPNVLHVWRVAYVKCKG